MRFTPRSNSIFLAQVCSTLSPPLNKKDAGARHRHLTLSLLAGPDRDFLQHFQRLPDERRDVTRLPRGDEVPIDDHLLVDHGGPDLGEVILDGFPRRQLATLDYSP